ncbi:uncharacterized protein LOC130630383 isoform X2 [Hydractinia symbiolongicarpus]|uniref:uncharacterized protein LOC130630383 isoform X2 n=1 Tax=Hydractinia symbiolongicarpus TaxID=13093 RepID=UPI002549CB2B|nr:uncharacterized protein LOC130630383 isoform X2 [Hydractinia symbiolongicarpus]
MSNKNDEKCLNRGGEYFDPRIIEQCIRAVCLIKIPKKGNASGFFANIKIIKKETEEVEEWKVIVTNNHVIKNKSVAEKAEVYFNFDQPIILDEMKHYKLKPELLFLTHEEPLDFTIVAFESNEIEELGIIPIPFEKVDEPNIGDVVTIFQHPKGKPKKGSSQKVVEISSTNICYHADTDKGSSGSPVLRDYKLIAIHKGGVNKGYNYGTLCNQILEYLETGQYRPEIHPMMVAYQAYLKVPGDLDLQKDIAACLMDFKNRIVEEAFAGPYHKYPFLHVLGRAFCERGVKPPLKKINDAFEAFGKYGLILDLDSVLKSPFKEGVTADIAFHDGNNKMQVFKKISNELVDDELVAYFLLPFTRVVRIYQDNSISRKFLEVLIRWSSDNPPEMVTWQRLRSLLLFFECKVLVKEIEEKFAKR